MSRKSTCYIKNKKAKGEKITVLTAYDYPTARLLDEAGIDMVLVGDSLGMVVLGYDNTLAVTMEDMLHHTRAVARGCKQALVVTDMPFLSYHISLAESVRNAGRLIQEGGAQAVKLEGGAEQADVIRALTAAGIPVVGHIGLTPQAVYQLGGFKVQGKGEEEAAKLLRDAKAVAEAGAFALVLECVPAPLAKLITAKTPIPTIGIGAGKDCDGQVLVINDLIGLSDISAKFVKRYADLGCQIKTAVTTYIRDVEEGNFPGEDHSFQMNEAQLARLY